MPAAVDVWERNFTEQLDKIGHLRPSFPIVSLDTEFSGILRSTPHQSTEEKRYGDLKYNVDNLSMIQLGISLFDASGNLGGVWQINFSDCDPDTDPSSPAHVRGSGIDLKRNQREGVPSLRCAALLRRQLFSHGACEFVTFHGLYDVGYIVKMFTGGRPLPDTLEEFIRETTGIFGGRLFDIKNMARLCRGLLGGKLSLTTLAKILDVKAKGVAHQAGFDSLVTGLSFHEMRKRWAKRDEVEASMILYGLEGACRESKCGSSSFYHHPPPSRCPPASPTRFMVPQTRFMVPQQRMCTPCDFPSRHFMSSGWDGGATILPPPATHVVWLPAAPIRHHPFHRVSVPLSFCF